MNRHKTSIFLGSLAWLAAASIALTASAQTRTLRIVTYNIEADINGDSVPLPGLIAPPSNTSNVAAGGVVEGIGEEIVSGDPAQPLDVLALNETTSNPLTVTPIANGMNAFYGVPGMYTNSTYQSNTNQGVTDGGGPNALVYNTTTLQLLASVPVEPPGGAANLGSKYGEYREVMRYEFAPAGVVPASSNEFYVYVSHYKSGATASDQIARAGEAAIIRTNEAIDLSATARVIYVGDYNISSNTETSYQTIIAAAAPNGTVQGRGIDPMNTNNATVNWAKSTTATNILAEETEHDYELEYRDDFQIMTTNVYYGAPGGLQYVPGTYHVFGNDGQTAYYGSVNSTTNTALSHLAAGASISAAQLYYDLTNASDHLPVVADFTIPMPAPVITAAKLNGTNLNLTVANFISNEVYTVSMSTNLLLPFTNWTTVATNVIGSYGSFTYTLTNVAAQSSPPHFYFLSGK